MALNIPRLAGTIKQAFLECGAVEGVPLTTLSTKLAEAIIVELTENAELSINLGPPASGTIE